MHPRVCLHQVAFMRESTVDFIAFCRETGVPHMTLATPLLRRHTDDLDAVRRSLAAGGPKATVVNHPFATRPNLEEDRGEAAAGLQEAIDLTASLGAPLIYLLTGGRGSLDWEQAAQRFADLLEPCRRAAKEKGVTLLVENASPLNIDIHIAHTLADTILLAEIAKIGVCIDLQPACGEAGLSALFRRAAPITGLVQVSDYVLGDRVAPCRAVPGDGMVPLERLIGQVLETGYDGVFDLELVGPRIEAEGNKAASRRATEALSEILMKLGA